MSGKGGKRPGAGRPKGKRNNLSLKTRELALETGLLPHEILLQMARGEKFDVKIPSKVVGDDGVETITWRDEVYYPTFEERKDAAKAAAPYYSPKLQATQVSVGEDQTGKLKEMLDNLSGELPD